eukprot:GGOE01004998.1.p1 GENE.GGOE01004998.1~~GGOE01004998.1.p1  ORF type:complete len:656 (-),score=190.33 GGOE01004998.1:147-2093(-)
MSAATRMEIGATETKSGPVKNVTVTRKLQKVLDISMDDNFRDSLEYLSSFYLENTAKDRKNLRGLLEQRSLLLHENFLQEFNKVNQLFEATEADVRELAELCNGVTRILQETQQEAATLLATASALQTELQEVKEKEHQVNQFLQKFQLSAEEKANLKGDINGDFFSTLAKVHSIHKNCKELLNANHQQAGIEIMEEMYMYQLSGYERLFKYAHKMCLDIMLTDGPEITPNLITALDALRERPALWVQCMQEVTKGRRTAIVRNFFDALSAGSRPIDAQSSDALRYVGDMLAWIHQSVAEENELLQNFFEGKGAHPIVDTEGMEANDISKLELLDQIFEGLAKHLKVRIEQVLGSASAVHSGNMVVLFKLENILEFYSHAIPQILGPNAVLSMLLQDLKLNTMKVFFELLKNMSDKLLSEALEVSADLTAPALVHDILDKLTEMMETLSTSIIPKEEREAEFAHVLSAVVDPLVTLCEGARCSDPAAKALFTINSLYTVQTALSGYPFAKGKMDKLGKMLDDEAKQYARDQADRILDDFMVTGKLQQLMSKPPNTPASSIPVTSQSAITESLQALHGHIVKHGPVSPGLDQILSLRLRQDVKSHIALAICQAYEQLHSAVHDPANGYSEPSAVAPHTVSSVKELLHLI